MILSARKQAVRCFDEKDIYGGIEANGHRTAKRNKRSSERVFAYKSAKNVAGMIFLRIFAVLKTNMVPLVQLVRASDCGSECHGFESHRAPSELLVVIRLQGVFFFQHLKT